MKILKRPYLGELEMAVLEHLWSNGEFDAKSVHAALGKVRGISHNTIQSTLERLFKKKLLARKKLAMLMFIRPSLRVTNSWGE